jgi:hypothetical protein
MSTMIKRRADEAAAMATFSSQQVDPGEGVGFSADWVCRKQGGVENLGSVPPQAP